MGSDWYSFTCMLLGRGVIVAMKDVAKHLGLEHASFYDIEDALGDKSLSVPPRYTVLAVSERFLLFSPFGDESQTLESCVDVPASYIGTDKYKISVKPFPSDTPSPALLLKELCEVARSVTGRASPRMKPGLYVASGSFRKAKVEVLWKPETPVSPDDHSLPDIIPHDVTLRTKDGETMTYNRAILVFYGLEDKLGSGSNKAEVLIDHTNELGVTTLNTLVKASGASSISINADCIFLVGGTKEKIEVNRSVLAMHNDVLCKMVYGTENMPADLSKPIPLPDFDKEAVQLVFEVLMLHHKGVKTVPVGMELNVWSFLDFIGENPEDLNLKFDIFAKQSKSFGWSYDEDGKDDQWILPGDNDDISVEEESDGDIYLESSDDEDVLEGFESEPFSDSDEDMAAVDEEKTNNSAHQESEQIMEE